MLKFAFILDAPGTSFESYFGVYETKESHSIIVGADGMKDTKAIVEKLVNDGFTLFNFCGAYTDEMLEELSSLGNENTQMKHVNYLPSEEERIATLKSFAEYGIIIKTSGLDESTEISLKATGCNTYAIFVKDMDSAKVAAKELVSKGVYFMELCSWFDKDKTQEIIEAINEQVPVGSCGF